jgi:hypothetical protein
MVPSWYLKYISLLFQLFYDEYLLICIFFIDLGCKSVSRTRRDKKKMTYHQRYGSRSIFGSGSRRANMTHKKKKKLIKFHFLKCWMFSFECFSCSLDVLNRAPGIRVNCNF